MSKNICQNCGAIGAIDDLFCQECGSKFVIQDKSVYYDSNSRVREYKGYIQIIGIIEAIFGVFAMFIAGLLILVAALLPVIATSETFMSENEAMTWHPILPGSEGQIGNSSGIFLFVLLVLGFVALFILAYGILAIINGRRLMSYRRSGHSGSMVISVLSLLAMPMGTIFGIFSLYILTRPEVDQILS